MTNTISAAANPALANNLVKKAIQEENVAVIQPEIVPPSDNVVELPGGYITPTGEVVRVAEIRELTGKDEEAIGRATSMSKALLTVLQRCVVSIGGEKANEKMLDGLLSGDRDALLLGILKLTFGANPKVTCFCGGCQEMKDVLVSINSDIKVKVLTNPIEDRVFTVHGKAGEFTVQLPTGITQKEMLNNADKNPAELTTILLKNTVIKVNDTPVYSPLQIQNLGLVDRRAIVEAINERIPGPQFEALKTVCPDCEGEVTVPVTLDSLFRL
jgi:hypothetical protein